MLLIAERSEACTPGCTTVMGVVLYGFPFGVCVCVCVCARARARVFVHVCPRVRVCVCVRKSQISPPHDHVS